VSDIPLIDAVMKRRSVRGFLPKSVPQAVMNDIFELARWAPSGTNVQPWQVYVASGPVRDQLQQEFVRLVRAGVAETPDHRSDGRLGEPWRGRRRDCAKVLYKAMDIAWEDKAARGAAGLRNFELFDAPHVAFLCMNENFGVQSAADVGMYAQTLMLAMTAYGLASCAQGTMRHYPELVRDTFNLGPEIKVLFGISFGYEDATVAANNARTTRAPLQETVCFLGGDE
jgi:nitroreductase